MPSRVDFTSGGSGMVNVGAPRLGKASNPPKRSRRSGAQRTIRWRFPRAAAVGPVLIAVAVLWLGWTIILDTAAGTRARLDPQASLALRPELPAALAALAEERLLAGNAPADRVEIRRLAARALSEAPLESRALRLLALTAELDGDLDRADALMELAAARTQRDPVVGAWLFNRRARQADFGAALGHADALLRSRPHLQDEILPTLIAFAIDPEAKTALTTFLAQNPPWRSWYLREVSHQNRDPGVAFQIFSELQLGPSPPTDSELRPFLQDLAEDGRFEHAYIAWIQFLPDDRKRRIKYAYNGDFEFPLSGLPFDWTIGSIGGATTEVVARPDQPGGHALRVEFANRRIPFRHVGKLLLLPPGAYRLTGEFKADGVENERGLVWRISCAEAEKQVIGESEPVRGTVAWRGFTEIFEVPQSGCRAQRLTLILDARVALEEHIGGVAWFDNLAVERHEE